MADASMKREREELDESLLSSLHETPSDAQKSKTADDGDKKGQRWTPEQDEALRVAVEKHGQRNWKSIANEVDGRNHAQCLQRWNKVLKPGLVKGHWSFEEDSILERMVLQGCHSWAEVSAHIPGRTAKQCRERWRNHLDPSINKSPFTPEEDITIQQAYEQMGNRWTQIAELLPGRTEDAVKVRWKALNPNQKTNAKPGRPPLMTGTAGKARLPAGASANPDLMIATSISMLQHPLGAPMQPMYAPYTAPYGGDGMTALSMQHHQHDPQLHQQHLSPMHQQQHSPMHQQLQSPMHHQLQSPMHQQQQQQHTPHSPHFHQEQQPPVNYPVENHGSSTASDSLEPLGDDQHYDVDERDAAMLIELMRSRSSSSMISFGSARGLSSFMDLSPDELLASGELDEMLKAVSLVHEGGSSSSMSFGSKSLSSSFRLSSSSFSSARNLQKAIQSMDSQDKHIFTELIEELRAERASNGGAGTGAGEGDASQSDDVPNDPNVYSRQYSSSTYASSGDQSSESALPSLHDQTGDHHEDESEDAEDFLSDLMKTMHRPKRY